MPRTLTAGMVTAAQAATGEIFHLFDFLFSGTDFIRKVNFNLETVDTAELKGYVEPSNEASLGLGPFDLGSGAGAGQKPWAVATNVFDADGSNNWSCEFVAPRSIGQISQDPVGDPVDPGDLLQFFESADSVKPYPEAGYLGVAASVSNNGNFELDALTGIITESAGQAVLRASGRAQNQILVGGPEVCVSSIDVAHDNFKIWARAERVPSGTTFQVGIVFRSNHTTTNDTGIDTMRLYLEDNGDDDVDVVLQKRNGNTADFTEVVGTVPMAKGAGGVGPELKFGAIIQGDVATVFTGEAEVVLGTVDLTQGVDQSTNNDSGHQKVGLIIWNNAVVNVIDNLTVESVLEPQGPLYLTDAPHDVVWNDVKYVASKVSFDSVEETDGGGQAVRLAFDGVEQDVIDRIQVKNYTGHTATIRQAHIGSDGVIVADPVTLFGGLMNEGFEVRESFERQGGGSRVTTRIISPLLNKRNGVESSVLSHQKSYALDTFWRHLANASDAPIFWGNTTPVFLHGSGGSGVGGQDDSTELV